MSSLSLIIISGSEPFRPQFWQMKSQAITTTSTIKNVLLKLSKSPGPAIEVCREGDDFLVLLIGLNPGDVLPDHTTHKRARLFILSGSVFYRDANGELLLAEYDEHEIPVGVIHSLTATVQSICLLIKG